MYDLHMARRAPRDLSPLIYRTVVDCTPEIPISSAYYWYKPGYILGGKLWEPKLPLADNIIDPLTHINAQQGAINAQLTHINAHWRGD